MGLKALRCNRYTDVAKACCAGEDRLVASDFSGTDVLKGVALTAAVALAAGCIGKSTNDNYSKGPNNGSNTDVKTNDVHIQQNPGTDTHSQSNPETPKYPFDVSESYIKKMYQSPPGQRPLPSSYSYAGGGEALLNEGDVKGIYNGITDEFHWIKFNGISSKNDSPPVAHFDVYRVDLRGNVEEKQIALKNYELPHLIPKDKVEVQEMCKNIREYGAMLDFAGDDERFPAERLLVTASTISDKSVSVTMVGIYLNGFPCSGFEKEFSGN